MHGTDVTEDFHTTIPSVGLILTARAPMADISGKHDAHKARIRKDFPDDASPFLTT